MAGEASSDFFLSLPDVTCVDTSRLKISKLTGSDVSKDWAFLDGMAEDGLTSLLKGLGENSDLAERWAADIVETALELKIHCHLGGSQALKYSCA